MQCVFFITGDSESDPLISNAAGANINKSLAYTKYKFIGDKNFTW